MTDREEIEELREADAISRAEAHADELEFRWEQEKLAEIAADPDHDEWWWKSLSFAARPGEAGAGICAVAITPEEGPELMSRSDMIELRDFLTHVIEGTLPPYVAPEQPAPAEDDPVGGF